MFIYNSFKYLTCFEVKYLNIVIFLFLIRRYNNQASPSGPNRTNPGVGGGAYASRQNSQNNVNAQQAEVGPPGSKFCHECGSEFPVKWARFCSFCGDRRL